MKDRTRYYKNGSYVIDHKGVSLELCLRRFGMYLTCERAYFGFWCYSRRTGNTLMELRAW